MAKFAIYFYNVGNNHKLWQKSLCY